MIIGARQGGFNILETADLLGVAEGCRELCKKTKNIQ